MTAAIQNNPTPVLIIGAGPTGLVLAIWLRKKSIAVRIIDKSTEPGTTSRALAVQARTLEFYRQLGFAEKLIDNGVIAKEIKLRRKGTVVATAKIGELGKDVSPFSYLLFCSQDVHEEILCDILRNLGTEVQRNTELIEFKQNANGVVATLSTPQGKETVSADYICGCDGAHSTVRHDLNVNFPGGTYSQVFFVADTQAEGEMTTGLQISLSAKDFCIVMPIKKKNTIRLTGIVPPEVENKEKIVFADIADAVTQNTGLKINSVNWFSIYHVHHRVAEKFHVGRAFLLGDAAHIHSPAGGQGMNTGIGDAVNLAWKLADVINGRASEKLLNSFEPERIAFARVLVQTTDTAFSFVASRTPLGSFFRAYILPNIFALLTRVHSFIKLIFRTVSQTRIQYRNQPISRGSAGKIYGGDRLPWVKSNGSDNFTALESMDWQVHVYGVADSHFRDELKKLKLACNEFTWSGDAAAKGLLENAAYFIRPDGYVALALPQQNINELKSYLTSIAIGF